MVQNLVAMAIQPLPKLGREAIALKGAVARLSFLFHKLSRFSASLKT